MAFGYDRCGAHEAGEVIDALDHEFVFGKGRGTSVAARYPHVFGELPERPLRVVRGRGTWAACAAVRPITYRVEQLVLHGAMVGFVYTRPEFRGRGAGSALMQQLSVELRDSALDFGILWTGIPVFYARLGWLSADMGILGESRGYAGPVGVGSLPARQAPGDPGAAALVNEAKIRLVAIDSRFALAAEDFRRARSAPLVIRDLAAYSAVPLPGETVSSITAADGSDRLLAYAIIGVQGHAASVYDMMGEDSARRVLVSRLKALFDRIVINDTSTSNVEKITADLGFSWTPQRLAMVLPLTLRAKQCIRQLHIPWFDRI